MRQSLRALVGKKSDDGAAPTATAADTGIDPSVLGFASSSLGAMAALSSLEEEPARVRRASVVQPALDARRGSLREQRRHSFCLPDDAEEPPPPSEPDSFGAGLAAMGFGSTPKTPKLTGAGGSRAERPRAVSHVSDAKLGERAADIVSMIVRVVVLEVVEARGDVAHKPCAFTVSHRDVVVGKSKLSSALRHPTWRQTVELEINELLSAEITIALHGKAGDELGTAVMSTMSWSRSTTEVVHLDSWLECAQVATSVHVVVRCRNVVRFVVKGSHGNVFTRDQVRRHVLSLPVKRKDAAPTARDAAAAAMLPQQPPPDMRVSDLLADCASQPDQEDDLSSSWSDAPLAPVYDYKATTMPVVSPRYNAQPVALMYQSSNALYIEAATPDPLPAPSTRHHAKRGAPESKFHINESYQSLLERGASTTDNMTLIMDMVDASQDFVSIALVYGKIIINEAFLPEEQMTIKPVRSGGQLGGRKFICRSVLFKFAVDDGHLFSASTDPYACAAKVAGHELKGLRAYQSANVPGLCFPLMALVSFKGLTLVAMSLLPIDGSTLVYGSADAGVTVLDRDPEVSEKVRIASQALGLAPHKVAADTVSWSAVDLEGHRGTDGRIYLLDFSRAMPCLSFGDANEHLYKLFRPEFSKFYHTPLSADAFSRFQVDPVERARLNRDVMDAQEYLLKVHIPMVAIQLNAENLTECADVVTFAHRYGVNVRFLGAILNCLAKERLNQSADWDGDPKEAPRGLSRTMELIVMECIARVIKNVIRRRLRHRASDTKLLSDSYLYRQHGFIINLALGSSADSVTLWQQTMTPMLQKHFTMAAQFDARARLSDIVQGKYQVLRRVKKLCGLSISTGALEMLRDNPGRFDSAAFLDTVDVRSVKPRLKHVGGVERAKATMLQRKGETTVDPASALRYFERASRHWASAVAAEPHNGDVLGHHATTLLRRAELAVELHPEVAPDAALLSQINSAFTRAIAAAPTNAESYFEHGRALALAGALEEADLRFLQALLLDANNSESLLSYAMFLGSSELAASFAQRASMLQ